MTERWNLTKNDIQTIRVGSKPMKKVKLVNKTETTDVHIVPNEESGMPETVSRKVVANRGDVIELSDHKAKQLLDNGYAVAPDAELPKPFQAKEVE